MSIPKFELLTQYIIGIEKVLKAPSHMNVEVSPLNGNRVIDISVQDLRKLLEECVWDDGFGGWLLLWPGEVKDVDGCYQGICTDGDYWRAVIREPEYYI